MAPKPSRLLLLGLLVPACAVYDASLVQIGVEASSGTGSQAGSQQAGRGGSPGPSCDRGGYGGVNAGATSVTAGSGGMAAGVGGAPGDVSGEGGGAGEPPAAWQGVDITSAGVPIAFITTPTGGGNPSLEVLRNGAFPPLGSANSSQQYDTFTDDPGRTEDWLGYEFGAARSFVRVTFQNGIVFDNGGWFESLGLQVRNGDIWSDVRDVRATPNYAGQGGPSYAVYELDFSAVGGDAIRVFGVPGGSSRFVSCGELRVFEEGSSN